MRRGQACQREMRVRQTDQKRSVRLREIIQCMVIYLVLVLVLELVGKIEK
jgi:hypothetical protein